MSKQMILTLATVLALAVTGEAADEPPTIRVSGTGRVSAAPDMAEISIGVSSSGKTAQVALTKNVTEMTNLMNAFKVKEIADKDIQTSQIQVQQIYENDPQTRTQRAIGYSVTNTVTVRVRKIAELGSLLDAVVQAGANQIYGVSFRISETEKLLDQARVKAVADAKRKALQLANEAGVELGAIRNIVEADGFMPSPMPMSFGRGMMAAPAAAPMPISAGEQDLSVTVNVSFAIVPPKDAK